MVSSAVKEVVARVGFNWSGLLWGQVMSLLSFVYNTAYSIQTDFKLDMIFVQLALSYALAATCFWVYRIARKYYYPSVMSHSTNAKLMPTWPLTQACVATSLLDYLGSLQALFAANYVSVPLVCMLSTVSIPIVMLLSHMAWKERYRPRHYIGASLAVLGSIVLFSLQHSAGGNSSEPSLSKGWKPVIGFFLSLGSALCYGIYNVAMEGLLKSYLAEEVGIVGVLATNSSFSTLWATMFFVGLRFNEIQFYKSKHAYLIPCYVVPLAVFTVALPVFLGRYSAALLTLSLLTFNFYLLPVEAYWFNKNVMTFSYLVPFLVVVIGIGVYNAPPFWRKQSTDVPHDLEKEISD